MAVAAHHPMTDCQAARVHPLPRWTDLAAGYRHTLALWRDRVRERRAFAFLTDRELDDLGLTRWDVAEEVGKPFWRG